MPTDRELREAYRELLRLRAGGERTGCVAPEGILALVERTGEESERLRILDHVMACPSCRHDFGLLQAASATRSGGPEPAHPWWPLPPRTMAWAASLVLLLGAGTVWLSRGPTGGEPLLRGEGTHIHLVAPEPGSAADEGATFTWRAYPEAFVYVLEVVRGDGTVVVERTTSDTVLAVPGLRALLQGVEAEWWVRARLEDGSQVSSAPRRIIPPPL